MIGMGFSDKPVAYEYSVDDHADMHEALLATWVSSPRTSWPTTSATRSARKCWPATSSAEQVLRRAAHRVDHLAQRRHVQRGVHAAAAAEGDVANPAGGHHESAAGQPAVAAADRADDQRDVRPDTKPSRRMLDLFHQILEYNDGKRVMHKVGRFVNDRYTHRNRWVRAMRQTDGADAADRRARRPELRAAHGASATCEVIPNPDVVMLDDDIGHWPQIEAPDAVLDAFPGPHRPVSRRARWLAEQPPRRAQRHAAPAATAGRRASRRNASTAGLGVVGRLPVPAQPAHHLGGDQVLRRAPTPVRTARPGRRGRPPAARPPRACGGSTATPAADRSAVRRCRAGRGLSRRAASASSQTCALRRCLDPPKTGSAVSSSTVFGSAVAALMIAESGRIRPGAMSRRRAMWSRVVHSSRTAASARRSRTLWMPDVRRHRSRRVGARFEGAQVFEFLCGPIGFALLGQHRGDRGRAVREHLDVEGGVVQPLRAAAGAWTSRRRRGPSSGRGPSSRSTIVARFTRSNPASRPANSVS